MGHGFEGDCVARQAFDGVAPQVNGACPATSTPGTAVRSMWWASKWSTITVPVACVVSARHLGVRERSCERARCRRSGRRAWCRGWGWDAALAPRRPRRSSGCAPRRRYLGTPGTARRASACPTTVAAASTTRPSKSTTTMSAGRRSSYGTPLGLMANTPRSRSAALTLPHVRVTSPSAGRRRLAAQTSSRSSSATVGVLAYRPWPRR